MFQIDRYEKGIPDGAWLDAEFLNGNRITLQANTIKHVSFYHDTPLFNDDRAGHFCEVIMTSGTRWVLSFVSYEDLKPLLMKNQLLPIPEAAVIVVKELKICKEPPKEPEACLKVEIPGHFG